MFQHLGYGEANAFYRFGKAVSDTKSKLATKHNKWPKNNQ